jgi:hypothetical protein
MYTNKQQTEHGYHIDNTVAVERYETIWLSNTKEEIHCITAKTTSQETTIKTIMMNNSVWQNKL